MLRKGRCVQLRYCLACALAACAVLAVPGGHAQSGRGTVPIDPGTAGPLGTRIDHAGDDMNAGLDPALRARREVSRKTVRRERLVDSADRLLKLTQQFEARLSEHSGLTPDDERRLDEIAKLAREVRSRMMD